MRPLKLTLSAFGSYAGTETVDFTTFGENGLYLVTGETDRNNDYSRFSSLNTLLYDYSEKEIEFIIDTAKFLRDRVVVE